MEYNFYFDICALCILVAILGITLFVTWVPTYSNRMFVFLVITVFLSTLAERSETLMQMRGPNGSPYFHTAEMIVGSVYFFMHILSAAAYYMYILSVLNIRLDIRKQFTGVFLPFLSGAILIAVNFFTPLLFTYDEMGIYHRGRFVMLIYLLAAYMLTRGVMAILKDRGVVKIRTRRVMINYIILSVIGILIQMIFPHMLVESFANSIAIALMYITIQSPSQMTDAGLQVLNRKAFLSSVGADLARNATISSVFICVDYVQSISDKMGHEQVLLLMRQIVRYLSRFKRYGYLYRYSRQVFVLAMRVPDNAQETAIQEMIARRFEAPWVFRDMQVKIEATSFRLCSPEHYKTMDELMETVSILIMPEMHAGRSMITVDKNAVERVMDNRHFTDLVRYAVDSDSAQVRYQPVFRRGDHLVIGYDAHLMIPDQNGEGFIQGTEKLNYNVKGAVIADADEFILKKVCRFLRECREAGEQNKVISARLSWSELARPDFKEQILEILRVEGVHFSSILFKLQETTLSNLGQREEEAVNWLVSKGALIVIEDFGMGYADIARLRRIHVSSIVLAHSLLESAMSSDEFTHLVKGIVDMLHDIRITVVIDRIQSRRELEMAEELGCDLVQGNYLGEPLEGDVSLPIWDPNTRREDDD